MQKNLYIVKSLSDLMTSFKIGDIVEASEYSILGCGYVIVKTTDRNVIGFAKKENLDSLQKTALEDLLDNIDNLNSACLTIDAGMMNNLKELAQIVRKKME